MRVETARQVLGVGARDDLATIRRRYHALARDRHPDAGGDVEAFRVLQQAYTTLVHEQPPAPAMSPSWGRFATVDDGARARAEAADRLRRTEDRALAVDVDAIDWGRALPSRPVALDHELLAVLGAAEIPVATVTARSRGPRGLLNRAAAVLEESLTAELSCGVRLHGGHGVRLTASKRRLRRHLADRTLPEGWVVRQANSTAFVAECRVDHGPYARVNALRHATVARAALDALDWPLGCWMLTSPLAA